MARTDLYLQHELELLGLGGEKYIVPEQQILPSIEIKGGVHTMFITVNDIVVREVNPQNNTMLYNFVGQRHYKQNWSTGGCYLDPKPVS